MSCVCDESEKSHLKSEEKRASVSWLLIKRVARTMEKCISKKKRREDVEFKSVLIFILNSGYFGVNI